MPNVDITTVSHAARSPIHHRIARSAWNILIPPLAGRHHRRYDGRAPLLFLDTLLALCLIFLLGLNIFFLTNRVVVELPAVDVVLAVPESVTSGGRVAAALTVRNRGAIELR